MNAEQIDEMVTAYIDCALWSSTEDGYWDEAANMFVVQEDLPDNDAQTWPMDEFFEAENIAPETLAKMTEDCQAFYTANADDLANMDPQQAGHDYWLTRNGHGAGFWDRGLGALGERLSAACRYQDFNLYVGDDGKIYGQ